MYVFEETQKFRQWWIYAILLFSIAGVYLSIYQETDGFTNFNQLGPLIFGLFFIAIILYFFTLQLKTRIDQVGIKTEFRPLLIFKREFKWDEIATCNIREYSALTEYGGWGIRGMFPVKAYTIQGSYGIQIVTKDNVHFLIGTQEPEKAKATIKKYMDVNQN